MEICYLILFKLFDVIYMGSEPADERYLSMEDLYLSLSL